MAAPAGYWVAFLTRPPGGRTQAEDPQPSPRPGTAAWWLVRENQPARKRRRRSLTLEAILDASLALLDAKGADALTMRSVADALGCGPASLYHDVRNREQLVTLLADRAISVASSAPLAALDWVGQAAWSAHLIPRAPASAPRTGVGPAGDAATRPQLAGRAGVRRRPVHRGWAESPAGIRRSDGAGHLHRRFGAVQLRPGGLRPQRAP